MISPLVPARSALHADLAKIRVLSRRGEPDSACSLATRAYDDSVRRSDVPGRAEIATELAWLSMMLGHGEEGIAYARIAMAIFEAMGDAEGESQARAALGWLLSGVGDKRAIDEAERALTLSKGLGGEGAGDATAAIAQLAAGVVYYVLGEYEFALRHLETAHGFADAASDQVLQGRVLLNIATVRSAMASAPPARAEAAHVMRSALRLSLAAGDAWAARIALCNLAELLTENGTPEDGLALLQQYHLLGGEPSSPDRAHFDHTKARCRIAQGRLAEAETLLHQCLAHCGEGNWIELRVQATSDLADVLASQGRHAEAFAAHRRFHALYVSQSDAATRRRARAVASEHEMQVLSREVEAARAEAMSLAETNAALAARTDLLLRHSLEDGLTSLPNRRCLDQAFEVIRTKPAPYAVAMIDIDHFKSVNDELSHPVGDRVLRSVARLLREELRAPDLLARYGGEEFTALIDTADGGDAFVIGERLRLAVRAEPWHRIARDLRVTISVGIALWNEADDPYEVLAIADRRLRQAKNAGRDRIVSALAGASGLPEATRAGMLDVH